MEGVASHGNSALPFGIPEIDRRLPGGGLKLGALHEVAGTGDGAAHGAAAALFAASIAAHRSGKVLWCLTRPDLFAPALALGGLTPDRVVYVEARDEDSLLGCYEEGLRHKGLAAVIAEVGKLSLTTSRRLQLAAESSGALGLIVRRWRRPEQAREYAQPTASLTRWRVTALPSASLPVAGIGRARWRLELMRCRGGDQAVFNVEAPNGQGDGKNCIALFSDLAYRQDLSDIGRLRAVS